MVAPAAFTMGPDLEAVAVEADVVVKVEAEHAKLRRRRRRGFGIELGVCRQQRDERRVVQTGSTRAS